MAFLSFKYLDSSTTTLIGQRNSKNTKSIYLRGVDGIPFNLAPYIVPHDCYLTNITATGSSSDSWNVYVRSNGSNILGATTTVAAGSTTYKIEPLNIQLYAGTPLEIYVETISNIDYPSVTLTFKFSIL